MQDLKMSKRSMKRIFNNPDLVPMREYLSYKSIDKIRVLLTELLYGKVTWWIKSISICSVIANMAPKKYLKYYLDISLAICFMISYQPIAQHMAYAPIQRYSTNNSDNSEVVEEDKQINEDMHIADWWWTI